MLVPKHTRASRRQTFRQGGAGLLNTLINKLPVELHIPGYKFCGPGTRLEKRLARGDRGINPLDEACRDHDIAYSTYSDLRSRHQADKVLASKAWHRARAKDSSFGERAAALTVAGLMKGKTAVGMGVSRKRRRTRKRKSTIGKGVSRKRRLSRKTKRSGGSIGGRVGRKRRSGKNAIGKKRRRSRVLHTPKQGGFLPFLLPLLGAIGSLGGGAAAIAKAVGDSKAKAKQLQEQQRHDRQMEAIARGKGLFLKPYNPSTNRTGRGLYLKSNLSKNSRSNYRIAR